MKPLVQREFRFRQNALALWNIMAKLQKEFSAQSARFDNTAERLCFLLKFLIDKCEPRNTSRIFYEHLLFFIQNTDPSDEPDLYATFVFYMYGKISNILYNPLPALGFRQLMHLKRKGTLNIFKAHDSGIDLKNHPSRRRILIAKFLIENYFDNQLVF
jgi:hypothetical protein